MGKENSGERDGTGPARDSYQNQTAHAGQRECQGESCPNKEGE